MAWLSVTQHFGCLPQETSLMNTRETDGALIIQVLTTKDLKSIRVTTVESLGCCWVVGEETVPPRGPPVTEGRGICSWLVEDGATLWNLEWIWLLLGWGEGLWQNRVWPFPISLTRS